MLKIGSLPKQVALILIFIIGTAAYSQVGIGTTSPNLNSLLELNSTVATPGGLRLPRLALTNTTVAAPLSAHVQGMFVYNTNTTVNVTPGVYYNTGTAWVRVNSNVPGNEWIITGNAITAAGGGTTTTDGTNFIGTTTNQNLNFRTNGIYRGRFSNLGEFFVGTQNTVIPGDLMNAVSNATFPWAINGYSDFDGSGVYGSVLSGNTVYGGVQGEYFGTSATGAGVRGIYGGSGLGYGVMGTNYGAFAGVRPGVMGQSISGFGNQQIGVMGQYSGLAWGIGVYGVGFGGGIIAGNQDIAVVGWRGNNANYSGYFNGNHVIANGTKSASVGTSKGNQLLYVAESPEVWFEDYGRAKLVNGFAEVKLDELFLETVFIDDDHPMIVFLQEEGDSNGIYVLPGKDSFIVKEKNGGTSDILFTYKISAKRLHFQDHRFGNDPVWGEGDTRKYNQYATPPPLNYNENVRFQEEQKRNYRPTPMPEGFTTYLELQEKMKTNTVRPKNDNGFKKEKSEKQENEVKKDKIKKE